MPIFSRYHRGMTYYIILLIKSIICIHVYNISSHYLIAKTIDIIQIKKPNVFSIFLNRFILYKLPKLNTGKVHTVGTEFFYMDADNQNFKITTMQNVIRPNRNPLFQTLKPLYSNVGIQ